MGGYLNPHQKIYTSNLSENLIALVRPINNYVSNTPHPINLYICPKNEISENAKIIKTELNGQRCLGLFKLQENQLLYCSEKKPQLIKINLEDKKTKIEDNFLDKLTANITVGSSINILINFKNQKNENIIIIQDTKHKTIFLKYDNEQNKFIKLNILNLDFLILNYLDKGDYIVLHSEYKYAFNDIDKYYINFLNKNSLKFDKDPIFYKETKIEKIKNPPLIINELMIDINENNFILADIKNNEKIYLNVFNINKNEILEKFEFDNLLNSDVQIEKNKKYHYEYDFFNKIFNNKIIIQMFGRTIEEQVRKDVYKISKKGNFITVYYINIKNHIEKLFDLKFRCSYMQMNYFIYLIMEGVYGDINKRCDDKNACKEWFENKFSEFKRDIDENKFDLLKDDQDQPNSHV